MNKLKILILSFIFCSHISFSQRDTVRLGNLNSTQNRRSEIIPFNGKYDYSWSSAIYTSDQFSSFEGDINQIAFHIANNANYKMLNQKIYARLTNEITTSNSNYPNLNEYTLLYSGDITYEGAGWKYINFQTSLNYQTGKNIEFIFENRDGNSKDNCLGNLATCTPKFSYSELTTNVGRRDYKDKLFPSECNMCDLNTRRPIIIIVSPPCKGMSNGTVSPSTLNLCSGNNSILMMTPNNPNFTGYNVSWQTSSDQINWTTQIVAGTGLPENQFQVGAINNSASNITSYYRAILTKYGTSDISESVCQRTTNIATVIIYPQINVSISSNITPAYFNATYNNITLSSSVTGGVSPYTYQWLNSSNIIVANTANYSPNLGSIYKLNVIDNNGCSSLSNQISVNASPQIISYAKLSKYYSGSCYNLYQNKLFFIYNEEYKGHSLRYNLYNSQHQIIASESSNNLLNTLNVFLGDNRLIVDLSSSSISPGIYTIEVFDEKNEKQFIKFKK